MTPGRESNDKNRVVENPPARRRKHKTAITILAVLALGILAVIIWAPKVANWIRAEEGTSGTAPSRGPAGTAVELMAPSPEDLQQGHRLFLRDCASCHGNNGDGISHVTNTLHPKPFDLRMLQLNFAFVAQAIQDGIQGTDMPAWHSYTNRQVRQVAAYTVSLGRPDHLPVQERIAPPDVLAEAGRRVYAMHCLRCHGEQGNGKGPDAEKYKPLPASFIEARPSYALAIHVIRNGVSGTAMQSWPLLTPGEIQAVTYYIRSLYAGPEPAVENAKLKEGPRTGNAGTGPRAWPALNLASLPSGPRGESIRLGMRVFLETPKYAKPYVGNQLSCGDCHLQAGTAAYGVPLIGAPTWFPTFSRRAGHMISLKDRIQECFTRSESGHPLPYDGPEMDGLVAFMSWVSEGKAPATPSTGRGLVKLPALHGNAARGKKIFTDNCAGCHGSDGAGVPPIIPPLWGPGSYNAGAGMNRVGKMAAFVQRNMPQNHPKSLTPQQAYDVSAYVASKPHSRFNPAYSKY